MRYLGSGVVSVPSGSVPNHGMVLGIGQTYQNVTKFELGKVVMLLPSRFRNTIDKNSAKLNHQNVADDRATMARIRTFSKRPTDGPFSNGDQNRFGR